MRLLVVAAAAMVRDGRVLVSQRSPGRSMAGLWEFPGGKLEAGETPEAALSRELAEEIGVLAHPSAFVPLTFASHGYEEFHLLMPLFVLREWTGEPEAREVSAIRFVTADDLAGLPMPAADAPLIGHIATLLRR
jgi:8-oxo-dGTP diphosphatase